MIEKPKKERRFLKILGKVGEILVQELLIKVGKSLVQKIGGKKNLPSIIFLLLFYNIAFASIDSIPYPITGNKQRLGWQTTGNGLVYRGRASDTITKPSNYANKDIKAYMLVDTVNNVMYSYIASKGGWKFNNTDTVIIQGATMPFDSITFNTAKDGTVGVGEVEYNDTQGSLIQGLKGGNVTNVIGQQLHQRVNNRTGATLNKGDVVYLSGSQGNRITVAKAIATSDPTSANTFGIVAESIADNASGYVITEGLITGLNTSALTQDSAVYLSGTTAGALTSTKPQAPIHGVYIGVCVKSNSGSGELFCKVRNGQELDELHDVQITSPVNNASLYYKSSEGLWRDTTAALLVSDTAAMLTPYFRDGDTTSLNLTSRFASKLNLSDTASMLTNYLRTGVAANIYLPLTGGTLTGGLNGTTANFTSSVGIGTTTPQKPLEVIGNINDFVSVGVKTLAPYNYTGIHFGYREDNLLYRKSAIVFQRNDTEVGDNDGSGKIHLLNVNFGSNVRSADLRDAKLTISNTGRIGIKDTTPLYDLSVNGTLGVTGFSTFNTGAVINENSNDSDTRIESDGNANMVFVDASTDRVGIGTNAPTKTLDINGEVKISTTTATPTSLLGKDGSNVVGNVRVITPLTLAGDSINLNTVPISKGGTGSTSESGARSNLGVGYVFYASTAGDAIQLSSNKVFIVNSGGASTTTITLGTATAGRLYMIKNLATGTVISDSSNVIPLNGGSAGTAILSAGNLTTQWCSLVCDGTNWHIMQSN